MIAAMLPRRHLAVASCPNCGHGAPGNFCPECGQAQGPVRITTREIVDEIAGEFLQFDSKLVRTLLTLVFRPGFLAREYFEGRRQRYVRPFRLYLGASVLYFLVLAVLTARMPERFGHGFLASADAIEALRQWTPFAAAHPLGKAGGPELAERMWQVFLQYGPKVQMLAIPLYACLLWWVYRDARRTYAEHFVFALHLHAFQFMLNLVTALVFVAAPPGGAQKTGLFLFSLTWVYLFAALRTVYLAGRARTLWRTLTLSFLNNFALGFVMCALLGVELAFT
jgi:hypothetical protein